MMEYQRLLPIFTAALMIITLICCVLITKTNDSYVGGLGWPYFSDMGRDTPSYYIFATGLTIVGFCVIIIWYSNYLYQHPILLEALSQHKISQNIYRCHIAVSILGIVSSIGLPVLSILDVARYPSIHNYGAYWFIVFEAIAVALNAIVTKAIWKLSMNQETEFMNVSGNPHVQSIAKNRSTQILKEYHWQLWSMAIFWIAFLIYIPIGLAVNCKWKRLRISDCISKDLGLEYCSDEMRYNATHTRLWNYSDCIETNQLRAGSQIILILSLIAYMVSFNFHFTKIEVKRDETIYSEIRTEA